MGTARILALPKAIGAEVLSKFVEYLPIYEGDRFCLMCSQACPVRRLTKSEATSPHGWALLVSSVERGMLPWNPEAVDVLYQCADCGNCQGNCATDRPLPYAIQAARAEVVRLGHAPHGLEQLDHNLRTWGNPYGAIQSSGAADSPSAAALLVGDAAHFLEPQAIDAAEQLLRSVGISASPVRRGYSTGYLPYTLGLWDTARELAQATVDAVKAGGATRVITLSAADAHTLKHVYAELEVDAGGIEVTTLTAVLAQAAEQNQLSVRARTAQPYTYHDAAQALRLPGHAQAARLLAGRVMGSAPLEMLYREKLATAIGTSGGLSFTHPALAERLARMRLAEAVETGAQAILTDDFLDAHALKQYAAGIQVYNLFELLADA